MTVTVLKVCALPTKTFQVQTCSSVLRVSGQWVGIGRLDYFYYWKYIGTTYK